MKGNTIVRSALGTGLILLIPLVLTLLNPASHLNGGSGGGFDWGPGDFVIMGALLFATGLALQFAARRLPDPAHRLLAYIGIVGLLLAIWVELAVDGVSQLLRFLF